MRPGKIAVYGVPTAAAARAAGVERASWVLRQEGLLGALKARGLTVVNLSDLSVFPHRVDDEHPRARNAELVACAVRTAADEMTRALEEGLVLLLGGDCTMGAGAALGVRKARGVAPGLRLAGAPWAPPTIPRWFRGLWWRPSGMPQKM